MGAIGIKYIEQRIVQRTARAVIMFLKVEKGNRWFMWFGLLLLDSLQIKTSEIQ